jgi:hypothetical protein
MERMHLYRTRKKKEMNIYGKNKKEPTMNNISKYLNQLDLTCDNTKKQTS